MSATKYVPRPATVGPYQGIFEESSTQKHRLGEKLELGDGRVFYYSKAGATDLDPGKLVVNPDQIADHVDQLVKAAGAVGDKTITMAIGATALTANQYAEGYLVTNDEAGEGHIYKIRGHKAYDASATDVKIDLYDGLVEALVADTSKVSLHLSPYSGLVVSVIDQADMPMGIPLIAVSANNYFWLQTWGMCPALADEAVTKGSMLTIGRGVAGAVERAEASATGNPIMPIIGFAVQDLVDTEYRPIFLTLAQ